MMRSVLGVVLMVALAGCAATPSSPRYAEAATTAKPDCVRSGTRIESQQGNCTQPGRSSGDLTRKHATTAAGALRGVDPGIIIRQ